MCGRLGKNARKHIFTSVLCQVKNCNITLGLSGHLKASKCFQLLFSSGQAQVSTVCGGVHTLRPCRAITS